MAYSAPALLLAALLSLPATAGSVGEPGRAASGPNPLENVYFGEQHLQLAAVWTDPDFDPSLHAVYYARVIEIPTTRWSTYDAVKLGLPVPDDVPALIQERAWSSPIWYTPEAKLVKKRDHYPGLQPFLP